MITDWWGWRPILPILQWRGRPVQEVGMKWWQWSIQTRPEEVCTDNCTEQCQAWPQWSPITWRASDNKANNNSLIRETVLGNGTVTGSYSWKDDEGMVSFFIVFASFKYLSIVAAFTISFVSISYILSLRPNFFWNLLNYDIRWDSSSTLQTGLVIEWNRYLSQFENNHDWLKLEYTH